MKHVSWMIALTIITVVGCGKAPPDHTQQLKDLSDKVASLSKELKDTKANRYKEDADLRRAFKTEMSGDLTVIAQDLRRTVETIRTDVTAAVKKQLDNARDAEAKLAKAKAEADATAVAEQRMVAERLEAAFTQFTVKVSGIEQRLHELRYPPLPEGNKPIFEVTHGSTGALEVKFADQPSRPKHLAVFLTWAEARKKPDDDFLKDLADLYRLNGANVLNDVLMLKPVIDGKIEEGDAKAGDMAKVWYVAWKYGDGKTPIPFTHMTMYDSRVQVLWYGGAGKPDTAKLESLFREPLLGLARFIGAKHVGAGSEWNPRVVSELIFKD